MRRRAGEVRGRRSCKRNRRGMSLLEVVIAAAVVAATFVAAVQTAAHAHAARVRTSDMARAVMLAEVALSEIRPKAYAEPGAGAAVSLGPDAGESHAARAGLDDIDDYHGLSVGSASGSALGWRVTVERVYEDTRAPAATETGLKRITVQVRRGQRVVYQAQEYRCQR